MCYVLKKNASAMCYVKPLEDPLSNTLHLKS